MHCQGPCSLGPCMSRLYCICLWHMWPQLHNRFFKDLEYTQYLVLVGGDCPLSNAKTQGRIQASSKPYVTNITCHIAVYFMLGSSKSKRQNITQWPFYLDLSMILGGNMHYFQSKMGNVSIFERSDKILGSFEDLDKRCGTRSFQETALPDNQGFYEV